MKFQLLVISLCFLFLGCGGGGFNKKAAWQNPNIFVQYSAEGASVLSPGWTSKIDASGISFNDKHTCTLITKRHVVMAKHYTRSTSVPVIFHDRKGNRVSRKLIAVKPAIGDVAVGLLDQPVPDSLKIYPMLRPVPDEGEKLRNKLVVVSNQFRQFHIHQVSSVYGGRIHFKFPSADHVGSGKKIISGDSGNPSFIMIRGQAVLIETHHTGGAGAGPYYGDANVQAAITRIIQATDNRYAIKTIPW